MCTNSKSRDETIEIFQKASCLYDTSNMLDPLKPYSLHNYKNFKK